MRSADQNQSIVVPEEHALWEQFRVPAADLGDLGEDPMAAEQIGKIISEAMINGPWTGC